MERVKWNWWDAMQLAKSTLSVGADGKSTLSMENSDIDSLFTFFKSYKDFCVEIHIDWTNWWIQKTWEKLFQTDFQGFY